MESWNEQLKTKILESEFSINEISDKTKIPTKFIEAIEKADFKSLPAEIFAKSQIERLFKFLGIDPSEALKDYEEFISPPEIISEEEPSCLLYTSPSPRDATLSRMPSSA